MYRNYFYFLFMCLYCQTVFLLFLYYFFSIYDWYFNHMVPDWHVTTSKNIVFEISTSTIVDTPFILQRECHFFLITFLSGHIYSILHCIFHVSLTEFELLLTRSELKVCVTIWSSSQSASSHYSLLLLPLLLFLLPPLIFLFLS